MPRTRSGPKPKLLELVERTEAHEWGSDEQLKRYLRTAPVERPTRDIEATIRQIPAETKKGPS